MGPVGLYVYLPVSGSGKKAQRQSRMQTRGVFAPYTDRVTLQQLHATRCPVHDMATMCALQLRMAGDVYYSTMKYDNICSAPE